MDLMLAGVLARPGRAGHRQAVGQTRATPASGWISDPRLPSPAMKENL
jgi:hypothetical protein